MVYNDPSVMSFIKARIPLEPKAESFYWLLTQLAHEAGYNTGVDSFTKESLERNVRHKPVPN